MDTYSICATRRSLYYILVVDWKQYIMCYVICLICRNIGTLWMSQDRVASPGPCLLGWPGRRRRQVLALMPDVQRTKADHGCPRVPHRLPQRGRMIEADGLPMMAASFNMIQNHADLLSGQSTASTSGKQVDDSMTSEVFGALVKSIVAQR